MEGLIKIMDPKQMDIFTYLIIEVFFNQVFPINSLKVYVLLILYPPNLYLFLIQASKDYLKFNHIAYKNYYK